MDAEAVKQDVKTLLLNVIADVAQSLVYGMFLLLFPVCIYLLSQKRSTTSIIMMCLISFMFAMSTLLWFARLENDVEIMLKLLNGTSNAKGDARLMSNALSLLNFVISDGVVVWRAWALARESRWALRACSACFGVTSFMALQVIVIRAIILSSLGEPLLSFLIDVTQTVHLSVSLITNIIATAVISLKAWRYQEELGGMSKMHTRTRAEKILILLVESGAAYCISATIVMVSTFIRLPHGTLGDIYQPIHAQLSGLYPTVVLVLVHQEKSLEETLFTTIPETASRHGHASQTVELRHMSSTTSLYSKPRSLQLPHTDRSVKFMPHQDSDKPLPAIPEHAFEHDQLPC